MAEKKVAKKAAKLKAEKKEKRSLLGKKKVKEVPKVVPQKEKEIKKDLQLPEPFAVIKFVVMTEKAIQLIEVQNKLVFVVERSATKNDIKKAVESAFSANVSTVQTMIDQLGRKRAFVKFAKPGDAGEIAIKLGII